jgi:hypothetical protein
VFATRRRYLDELRTSALFDTPLLARYRWDRTCTTASFIELMPSYSSVQTLLESQRMALHREMSQCVDEEIDGSVTFSRDHHGNGAGCLVGLVEALAPIEPPRIASDWRICGMARSREPRGGTQ